MMTIYNWLLIACWAVFIAYWAVSALGAKRNRSGNRFVRGILYRVGIAVLVIIALRVLFAGWFFSEALSQGETSPAIGVVGVLLAVIGIGFAIWARAYLGTNWGMPMTVKENPELVTTGPYAYVRHPIYTGVMLAILGSALVSGLIWFIVFVGAAAAFSYSATQEENVLMKEFPDTYPAYKRRTKMLVPFVF